MPDADKQQARRFNDDEPIINYFGYGPIINPIVRKRRGIQTIHEEVAMLPDYRLTFTYGGMVNIIPQRGYQVHGILVTFATTGDWTRCQAFDAGFSLDQLPVYPLGDEEGHERTTPIVAYVLLLNHDLSSSSSDTQDVKKLPQERYLTLIASGMRQYSFDQDYIDDYILSVPYTPTVKEPDAYRTFPQTSTVLPIITWEGYQRMLRRRNRSFNEICFVVGQKVIHVVPVMASKDLSASSNPCVAWLRQHAHGLPDSTLTLHRMIVDFNLPMIDFLEEITPPHIAWAENHYVEWFEQSDLSGTAVFRLVMSSENNPSPQRSRSWWWSCCLPKRQISDPVD